EVVVWRAVLVGRQQDVVDEKADGHRPRLSQAETRVRDPVQPRDDTDDAWQPGTAQRRRNAKRGTDNRLVIGAIRARGRFGEHRTDQRRHEASAPDHTKTGAGSVSS